MEMRLQGLPGFCGRIFLQRKTRNKRVVIVGVVSILLPGGKKNNRLKGGFDVCGSFYGTGYQKVVSYFFKSSANQDTTDVLWNNIIFRERNKF